MEERAAPWHTSFWDRLLSHTLPPASHSGLGHRWGCIGLEALVGSLVCEQSQGHGIHSCLQPRLLTDLHCVVIGLQGQGISRVQ